MLGHCQRIRQLSCCVIDNWHPRSATHYVATDVEIQVTRIVHVFMTFDQCAGHIQNFTDDAIWISW